MRKIAPAQIVLAACIFLIGAIAGAVVHQHGPDAQTSKACASQFPLTSRTLDCNDYDLSSAKTDALDRTLSDKIQEAVKEKKVTRASVWIRNLETKQYAAVNELNTFEPASLLKLPLAIAYYKYSEISPSVMDAKLTYTPPADFNEDMNYFTPDTTLQAGTSYTVRDLLDRMLRASDNGAYFTLVNSIDSNFHDRVLLDLGIRIPSDNQTFDFVTVRTYANIFRGLYNASYLSRDDAQELLETLARSDFEGIRAPLPKDTPVAHKFGERSFFDTNGKDLGKELHDCGIVYKGEFPYSICIMTAGNNFDTLRAVIADLSKMAYEGI